MHQMWSQFFSLLVQVAFDDQVRIGMAQMLESVPVEIQGDLPTKQVATVRFVDNAFTISVAVHTVDQAAPDRHRLIGMRFTSSYLVASEIKLAAN